MVVCKLQNEKLLYSPSLLLWLETKSQIQRCLCLKKGKSCWFLVQTAAPCPAAYTILKHPQFSGAVLFGSIGALSSYEDFETKPIEWTNEHNWCAHYHYLTPIPYSLSFLNSLMCRFPQYIRKERKRKVISLRSNRSNQISPATLDWVLLLHTTLVVALLLNGI